MPETPSCLPSGRQRIVTLVSALSAASHSLPPHQSPSANPPVAPAVPAYSPRSAP